MNNNYRKPSIINIITGIIFTLIFIVTYKLFMNKYTGNMALLVQVVTIAEAFIALISFLPKRKKVLNIHSKKYNTINIIAILFVVISVPLTALAGHYVLNGKHYNFISTVIVLELLIPFFFSFESKRPSVRELVIISVLCALAVSSRLVFYAVPQFKPIVAIIIISGICLGAEKGFLIGAISAFASNIVFGQGPWTHWQMLALGAMGFLAGILFTKLIPNKSKWSICIFGLIATVIVYGGIVNFSSLLYYPAITTDAIIATYSMGLPFDIVHGISTFFFLWFITEPMTEKLERIKSKYNILK